MGMGLGSRGLQHPLPTIPEGKFVLLCLSLLCYSNPDPDVAALQYGNCGFRKEFCMSQWQCTQ